MSDIRKNDVEGDAPEKETRPTRRDRSNFVPPVLDSDEFWEDEYDDFETFEKMPKGRKKNEWY